MPSDQPTNGPEVIRPHAVITPVRRPLLVRLRRALGTSALYSIGYGNVGSSIYYALGIVAFFALGATPLALLISGVLFVFTAATYAEGVGVVPEAGGSASFARRGFNDAVSFISGWGLFLTYIVTAVISALSAAHYLAGFWPALKEPQYAALAAMAGVTALTLLNILGVRESSRMSIVFVIIDLLTQLVIVVLGLVFLFSLPTLLGYVDWTGMRGTWPTPTNLVYGVAIGMVAYVGLESVAQMAQETREPGRTIPRALFLSVVTVLLLFTLIPLIALSAVDPQTFRAEWTENPVAAIVFHFPEYLDLSLPYLQMHLPLRVPAMTWIPVVATTILLVAANAGLLAGSRLTFAMTRHRQLPGPMGWIHPRFRTPVWALVVYWAAAMLLLAPGLLGVSRLIIKIGFLYVFGSMIAFALAHASVIALRYREPDAERPFRAWFNVRVGRASVPLTAVVGLLSTIVVFAMVLQFDPFTRTVGLTWMAAGIVLYVVYRRVSGLSLTRLVSDSTRTALRVAMRPSRALTVHALREQVKRILVPIHNTEEMDLLMPYAAQFATGLIATVRVLTVVQVPRALPLDAHLPDRQREAEQLLEAASDLAEGRYNIEVETDLLQARNPGVAIVEEAARDQADIILLGVTGHHDPGSTVDYVLHHAPCPVWVLFPPVG